MLSSPENCQVTTDYVIMRAIVLVFIIILATAIVPGTVTAAEPTPIIPGMDDGISDLYGMHPTMKGNTAIMNYIGECGIGQWHEEMMNEDFRSVHIPPGNSCGKQLVFTTRRAAGREDPTQITDIWIIRANETWSSSMDTVNPGGGSSRFRLQTEEERRAQNSLILGSVMILAILGIAFALIECGKKFS